LSAEHGATDVATEMMRRSVVSRRHASPWLLALSGCAIAQLVACEPAVVAPSAGRLVTSRAALRQVTLHGERRYALLGERLRFPVRLAPDAVLRTAFGIRSRVAGDSVGQPFDLTVALVVDGQRKPLFEIEVAGVAASSWSDIRLPLRSPLGPDAKGGEREIVGDLLLEATPRRRPVPEESVVWEVPRIEPVPRGDAPNLILLSIDTLRPDHLGCYGYERSTSPNIDRLAKQGILFERVISSASWTLPAHASMLTGLDPSRHNVVRNSQTEPLAERLDTVAELLWDNGYETAAYTGQLFLTAARGFAQGFGRFRDSLDAAPVKRFPRKVQWGLDWMEANRDRRFFLFLHTYAVHMPYRPDPPYDQRFDPEYQGVFKGGFDMDDFTRSSDGRDLSAAEVAHLRALYDGGIAQLDAVVGDLISGLQTRGLAENTCLVVTSDHGEEFREHGDLLHNHDKLFEELLRVPLIVWCPREANVPRRVDSLVSLVDVAPTLLALAGVDIPADLDGVDLVPLWRGTTNSVRAAAFSEVEKIASVRDDRFKLIWTPQRGIRQLFDLSVDGGETEDVSTRHPRIVKQLFKELRARRQRGRLEREESDTASARSPADLGDAQSERLRALGYTP